MNQIGHASPEEMERINALEAKLQAKAISRDEQLELALLYIEPGHDVVRATELLEGILAVNPEDHLARVWLAYLLVYQWMDPESLRNAIKISEDLASDERVSTPLRAAALLLKATAQRDLQSGDDPAPALRESIELAPDWISNRQLLGQVYEERGDRKAGEEQFRKALELSSFRPQTDNYADELFERLITIRGSNVAAELLRDKIREIRGEPSV